MTFDLLTRPEFYLSLLTLSAMEIVLGIDNIVFVAILAGKLPKRDQEKARRLGISLALFMRVGLLFAITWVMSLTTPLFSVLGKDISGRDLILLGGGLFLVAKATHEIHDKLEADEEEQRVLHGGTATLGLTVLQILLLDIVFSLDSVITAVGMAQHIVVMIAAMIIAVGAMLVFSGRISDFIDEHPTMKILALSFLLLIGVMLIAEAMGQHISKGYIYFAMAFSLLVELLNLRMRKRSSPVVLHGRVKDPNTSATRTEA
jgi:predicted tellurium resistance membrane protein TerC